MKLKINELEEDMRAKREAMKLAEDEMQTQLHHVSHVCCELGVVRCGDVSFGVFAGSVEFYRGGCTLGKFSLLHLPALVAWANGLMEALKAAGLTTDE